MITQKNKKTAKYKNKNFIRAAVIRSALKAQGYKLQDIANDLEITTAAITRSISDLSTIKKVDDWLIQKLGTAFK